MSEKKTVSKINYISQASYAIHIDNPKEQKTIDPRKIMASWFPWLATKEELETLKNNPTTHE